MSIPPSQYPESFKEKIFVNYCHNGSSPTEANSHYHNKHYEICCILKGKATYYIDNASRIDINQGEFIFLDKKAVHMSIEDESHECERIIINFNDQFLRMFTLSSHFLNQIFTEKIFRIPLEHKSEIVSILNELVYESDYNSLFSTNLVNCNVYRLLVALYRISTNTDFSKTLPPNPIIEAATKYICQNYSQNITLNDVAEHCYVSPSYLSRLFKKIIGVTFVKHLASIRIQNASLLLMETQKSLTEISQVCGFNSQSHFCSVFKEVKGVSPTELRKQYNISSQTS